jgi:hypothetical protein
MSELMRKVIRIFLDSGRAARYVKMVGCGQRFHGPMEWVFPQWPLRFCSHECRRGQKLKALSGGFD